ncbi:hypothetical protein LTR62_002035 [Meristemomyces frigidus]|uniref:Chloride channel protein n=1 Tax=Meristemomyces frigidus TaxID=1508187 RepID=A0AAN7TL79_9PEZI|nr:hypothetical protein LTR62_002035 [Meristemomyces frigidus]
MYEDERSPLLQADESGRPPLCLHDRRLSKLRQDEEASSIVKSHVSVEEQKMADIAIGERLPYNDYSTIDWLHDLVKDSYRHRYIHNRTGIRNRFLTLWDEASGWIAAALIGTLTACVAFLVDIAAATASDWKLGYCSRDPFLTREACCLGRTPLLSIRVFGQNNAAPPEVIGTDCPAFREWSSSFRSRFAIYVAIALAYGLISSLATLTTKRNLPAASLDPDDDADDDDGKTRTPPSEPISSPPQPSAAPSGKTMYMAAGSGIPEIKTILSGFIIPGFLDFKVLFVKAFGAVFAVSTGMCLGKEGPFVHISTCVGYLVAKQFPKYRDNGRKMREMLSAACASGLSVAFGAPIGGVLFSYEEISTYFPRKVLWRAFLCSLFAAMVLKALNPTGTGKLVLFETHYGTSYNPIHYLIFVLLGVAGGIFGGTFCRLNFLWSKWFRSFSLIKNYPVLEVFLVVAATALLQYPNPLTREPGDAIIKNLLVDCRSESSRTTSWVCQRESSDSGHERMAYTLYLLYGSLTKLVLTIITFGIKVPSGVIIPALDAGALFGRLVGQYTPLSSHISPGIFAMVGAAAFLAGVSRMTISLCVIMFELTGELEYIVPHMIAILVAKWVADALGRESVYDIAQTVLGHPFLDAEHAIQRVQREGVLAEELIPPRQTMEEITVVVPETNWVPRTVLETKLQQLRARGLMDAGLVLVQNHRQIQGYLSETELAFALTNLAPLYPSSTHIRLLGQVQEEGEFDLSHFVDRTPLAVCATAPMEYVIEMFGKLGVRYLMLTEEGTGRLVGVVVKKRVVAWLEGLGEG